MHLKKLNNTRDLGGFPTEDGRMICPGKLIRSGKLWKLPKSTRATLQGMGVKVIIDLRIDNEVEEYPSTMLEGAQYIRVPLICTATPGITFSKSMAGLMKDESKLIETQFKDADEYMHKIYTDILFNDESCSKIRDVFDIFLDTDTTDGCILWNCSGGKDRAGIIAMLLESVLGVPEELVIQDYIASQEFQHRKRNAQKVGLKIAPISHRFKELLYAFMDARPEYMQDAIDTMKEQYGSVTGYCKAELKLTDIEIETLRAKFLCPAQQG